MKSIPVSKARLGPIFDAVIESGQPVRLTSHNSSAILLGWKEWQAIEQTLLRLSTPAFGAAGDLRLPAALARPIATA